MSQAAAIARGGQAFAPAEEDELARLRAALRPDFLAEAGWDPDQRVLAPARTHPLLGLQECAVADCEAGIRTRGALLCTPCGERFRTSGVPLDQFVKLSSGKVSRLREVLCLVGGCERPSHDRRKLCSAHGRQRWALGVSVEEFLARDDVTPRASFGPCRVPACIRRARGRRGLCYPHDSRWRQALRDPTVRLAEWAAVQPPIGVDAIVILKGLPERVQVELLVAIQRRTDADTKTAVTVIRHVTRLLREHRMASVLDLAELDRATLRPEINTTVKWITAAVRVVLSDPVREQAKDVWDLRVMGLRGGMNFTALSQPWLREAAKAWVLEDIPRHRGTYPTRSSKLTVRSLASLSTSLRLSRPDHGNQPAALGRGDIVMFLNRLAHLENSGEITANTRVTDARQARMFLDDIRPLGLTLPGRPAAGLPADFVLRGADIPDEPNDDGPGRALPARVVETFVRNLDLFEKVCGRDMRRIVELLIDTGRRPGEICELGWDCLLQDAEGNPVLLYDDAKNYRPSRRLPISKDTARIVTAQKDDVRGRFPLTPVGELALFPRSRANPRGAHPLRDPTLNGAQRRFLEALPEPLVDDHGQEFDLAKATPYAFRHTYAQRHADAGVPLDVLRDLMGHRTAKTTQVYYRVNETRVRAAIDRVGRHQFDGQGRRVLREVARTLDVEHARTRVGQTAVPFGICTEPSNVKAGGTACPYRYVCVGCGHFRSDPSYLPELKSYLQQLLADRERLLAAVDLADWARDAVAPSEQEIDQVRELIRRVQADLDGLDDQDRQQIGDAITALRKTRQTVNLGVPRVRPPGLAS
ncbi:tyrosine-type recombinase/integrase [Parafrankia sp. FMc6]|uniref:tyrosine-type recombinase/integrase n=1 Tax=Parafrankia soli TaxID=2599596 RepID=UPI0034D3C4DB